MTQNPQQPQPDEVILLSESGVTSAKLEHPRYPGIEVQLTGKNGNAMVLISEVRKALRTAGVNDELITVFTAEAMSGDYMHVLTTCIQWVSVS